MRSSNFSPLSASDLVGAACIEFSVIAGGTLILHFDRRNSLRRPGQWRLHIESAWRLERNNEYITGALDLIVAEEESKAVMARELRAINSVIGLDVVEFAVLSPVNDLNLTFTSGYKVRSFCHAREGEGWELRHADGRRLGMGEPTKVRHWKERADSMLKKGPRVPRRP